jgi:hypothetical protein
MKMKIYRKKKKKRTTMSSQLNCIHTKIIKNTIYYKEILQLNKTKNEKLGLYIFISKHKHIMMNDISFFKFWKKIITVINK